MWSKKKVSEGFISHPPRGGGNVVDEEGFIVEAPQADEVDVEEPESPTVEYKDLELADKIKEIWVVQDRSAVDACKELGISLGVFNRIIVRYNISKKRTVEDENFGA